MKTGGSRKCNWEVCRFLSPSESGRVCRTTFHDILQAAMFVGRFTETTYVVRVPVSVILFVIHAV